MEEKKFKLIKISEEHYIVVDDSEIKEGDLIWYNKTIGKLIFSQDDLGQGYDIQFGMGVSYPIYDPLNIVKKIIYSTQPFNFDWIEPLSLTDVEELIYGYSVEKMTEEYAGSYGDFRQRREAYKSGFKAHQKLVKDKLFNIEDMEKAIKKALYYWTKNANTQSQAVSDIIQQLPPKTEWDVKFNEQGKLELL